MVALVSLLLVGVGCHDDGQSPDAAAAATATCDPLTPTTITLGSVVAVGKDATGTLYVDAAAGVFVSANGSLIRQHVVGSGENGSTYYTFSFTAPGADSTTAVDLIVQTGGASGPTMALGPDGSGKTQSTDDTTALTVVPSSTVDGMPVVNTPNVISYVGDAANGDVLVATVPMNDELAPVDGGIDDGGLSIFYGPPSAVAQRPITAFLESMSGNGQVTFLADGTPYDLKFGNVQGPDAGPLGMFALLELDPQGGPSMAITLRAPTPATTPADLSFTCLP